MHSPRKERLESPGWSQEWKLYYWNLLWIFKTILMHTHECLFNKSFINEQTDWWDLAHCFLWTVLAVEKIVSETWPIFFSSFAWMQNIGKGSLDLGKVSFKQGVPWSYLHLWDAVWKMEWWRKSFVTNKKKKVTGTFTVPQSITV